jgi:hypothetical protein
MGRRTLDNLDDTKAGLRAILQASFEHVELDTIGSIAVFAATTRTAANREGGVA